MRNAVQVLGSRRLRLFIAVCLVGITALVARSSVILTLGRSLTCDAGKEVAETILLDNLEQDYLLFERASKLRTERESMRVLVPMKAGHDGSSTSVERGIIQVMTSVSRLQNWEAVPVHLKEPITLSAAYQVRDFALREHIHALTLISPGFRSQRSHLVYAAVMKPAGIDVSCLPVFGVRTSESWADTWHGTEEVALQLAKLLYYRLWVLPLRT